MPPPFDAETIARVTFNLFALGIAGAGCCISVFLVFAVLVVINDVVWAIRKWQTTGAIIGMHKEMKRRSPDSTLPRAKRGENEMDPGNAPSTSRSQSSEKEKLLVSILILLIGFVSLACIIMMGYYFFATP